MYVSLALSQAYSQKDNLTLVTALAQKIFCDLFARTNFFILPFPHVLRALSGSFSVWELQTATTERASTREARVGALLGFLVLRHGFGHGFLTKTVRVLVRKLAWIRRELFLLFFFVPKTLRRPKSPNPRPFWKLFSQWFLWVLKPWFASCFSGC